MGNLHKPFLEGFQKTFLYNLEYEFKMYAGTVQG
jgi:hypothetical protein